MNIGRLNGLCGGFGVMGLVLVLVGLESYFVKVPATRKKNHIFS